MLRKLQVCLLYKHLSDTSGFGKKFLLWNSFNLCEFSLKCVLRLQYLSIAFGASNNSNNVMLGLI